MTYCVSCHRKTHTNVINLWHNYVSCICRSCGVLHLGRWQQSILVWAINQSIFPSEVQVAISRIIWELQPDLWLDRIPKCELMSGFDRRSVTVRSPISLCFYRKFAVRRINHARAFWTSVEHPNCSILSILDLIPTALLEDGFVVLYLVITSFIVKIVLYSRVFLKDWYKASEFTAQFCAFCQFSNVIQK